MLEKARQVVIPVDNGIRRAPRYGYAKASGAGLMDCSLHFHGVGKENHLDAEGERAWAHVKPDDPTAGLTGDINWSQDEIAANIKRLSGVALLQTLTGGQLAELGERLEYGEYWSGEEIITVGQPSDGVYLMVSGAAQAETKGGECLRTYAPPDIFGEMALESEQPRGATIRATGEDGTTTEVLKIPHVLCRWLRGNAGIRARLAKIRRGFERPRSQYQGVQGAHMTLSVATPGAFGASDAATALRSIGVTEKTVDEKETQLKKRLAREAGEVTAERELGLHERLDECAAERERETAPLGTRGRRIAAESGAKQPPGHDHEDIPLA